jgi:hypothetical protein
MSRKRTLFHAGLLLIPALLILCTAATASAANMFATVSPAGTLISGNAVSSVTYLGPGQYEVTFTSNVSQCSYVSTTFNTYSEAIQSYTAGGHLGANGVYVETKNQGGGLTDGGFNLVVICNVPKQFFAVVDYSSNLVRSTPGAVLTNPGAGRYRITFTTSVKNCAYLATVGDPANGLVFNPSGVYTGSGPNSRTVYIETKNPGGGLQSGVPFHLAVICANTPDTHIAVAGANGVPTRGSALTSTYRSSLGQYVLVSSEALSACATVATRGSVDKGVPFNPTTVEVAPGPATNTMAIQQRGLLFFGGANFDEAFHAATVCK